jgi:hypothetical protein
MPPLRWSPLKPGCGVLVFFCQSQESETEMPSRNRKVTSKYLKLPAGKKRKQWKRWPTRQVYFPIKGILIRIIKLQLCWPNKAL